MLFMDKYVILTDVTSDISEDIRKSFGVRDYVHGYVSFSDGRDLKTYMDWSQISREEFYAALSNKRLTVSTAPASPEEYYEIFRKYAEVGYDILSMSISSKISSTFSVAQKAAARVSEEFPECKIYCFDSQRMSGALGLLVLYAHELQNSGSSMEEVIDWLEQNKSRVHQMGPIDDLMFIARRGRISTGKAIMGSFAGVKPMGDCNTDGYVSVLGKAKGIKRALKATAAYVKALATEPQEQILLVVHSNREEYAVQLKELLEAQLQPGQVLLSDSFSASGTNIGPGMIGVYFLGEPITENNTVEKETLTRLLEECR